MYIRGLEVALRLLFLFRIMNVFQTANKSNILTNWTFLIFSHIYSKIFKVLSGFAVLYILRSINTIVDIMRRCLLTH